MKMGRMVVMGVALVAGTAMADVSLSGIFSDNMVLQRGKSVPVWGKAEPGEKVSVSFAGKTAEATADAKGDWTATLPALDVVKEGKELAVRGKTEIVLKNVLVGDVWLVSGQSNSEMSFGWGIVNGAAEIAKAKDFPNIRVTKFDHKISAWKSKYQTCNHPWVVANEKTLKGITAMGYFFARDINGRTGIPIGLLDDNWSGCLIEPFVAEEGLKLTKGFEKEYTDGIIGWRKKIASWCEKFIAAEREGGTETDIGWIPEMPIWGRQYNSMIAPIERFPITGALWYQGCSNGGEGMSYANKLLALVNGWRANWGYDFPFYVVQLASFTAKTDDPAGGNGYAKIRNAMRIATQTMIPKSGLAVAIDIGNAGDIHPKNKQDVGTRLARWARRDVYGEKDLVVSGPLYKSMKIEDGKVRISFDHVGKGLAIAKKDPNKPGMPEFDNDLEAKLKGFAIAGEDKRWYWANAEIDGKDVVVSAEEVANPVAVRYAFRANPMGDCNLYNKEGLPASPFRTDEW